MSPSRKKIVALAVFGWLASAITCDRALLAIENLKIGDRFPEFSLPLADGSGEFTLAQIQAKPTVILFWRPGQRYSLEALRDLVAIGQEIGLEKIGIVVVGTAPATAQDIQTALAGGTPAFPVLRDPDRTLYGKIGVIVSPTTLILDGKGTLRFVHASHPRTYHQVIRARLKFVLEEISEEEMKREVEPSVLKIDEELAAALRLYNLGRQQLAEGKSVEAMSLFEKAVSRYPSLSEARCALGFMKYSEGDLAGALDHFQTALAHSPTSPLAHLGKAVVLARTGQPDQAEAVLLSLLGQESVSSRARYELGRIYRERGDLDRAVSFYQDALTLIFPDPPRDRGAQPPGALPAAPGAAPPAPLPAPAQPQPVGLETPGARAAPAAAAPAAPPAPPAPSPAVAAPAAAEHPSITAVVPPPDARYIGVKSCKKCHFQQWKSWQETRMASAFELLKPGVRDDVKRARSLDPGKDYTTDPLCLACHTTGYGFPDGYPRTPPSGAGEIAAAKELAAVGCEACHGPGSKYSLVHKAIQDARRKYAPKELQDVGQYQVAVEVCAACHNWKGPCIAPGTVFKFEERKDKGTHKHYTLQFRSQ